MTDPLAFLAAVLPAAQRDAERLRDDLWWLGQEEVIRVYGSGDGLIAGADQAVHDLLAANQPSATLRRIAADRKILARHQPFENLEIVDMPKVGRVTRCAHDKQHWPCPDITDLAEGWGWTEETP